MIACDRDFSLKTEKRRFPIHNCCKEEQQNIFSKVLPCKTEKWLFPIHSCQKGMSLSETEVLQMQNAMREEKLPQESSELDEEIIDVLIAISVVSRRLAEKLRCQSENEKE